MRAGVNPLRRYYDWIDGDQQRVRGARWLYLLPFVVCWAPFLLTVVAMRLADRWPGWALTLAQALFAIGTAGALCWAIYLWVRLIALLGRKRG